MQEIILFTEIDAVKLLHYHCCNFLFSLDKNSNRASGNNYFAREIISHVEGETIEYNPGASFSVMKYMDVI